MLKMNKAPAFQFYAQDFLTGCAYLTNDEIGMYVKMICKQWTDGKIPVKRLEFLIGTKWENLSDELKEKFVFDGEFLHNKRLEIEREKQEKRSVKAQINAENRWEKQSKNPDNSGKGVQKEYRLKGVPQVYVLRCYNEKEEFIKIGITQEYISRRYNGNKMPYNYDVILQIFGANYTKIESELHQFLSKNRYMPEKKFGGSNECFHIKTIETIKKFKTIYDFEFRTKNQELTQIRRKYKTDAFLEDRSMKNEDEIEEEKEKEIEIEVKKSAISENLILPFNSENFKTEYENWKDYKLKEFRFKYKSIKSEQVFLNQLFEISNKHETTAISILKQSISNGWKGVFELKNNQQNGTTTNTSNRNR